MSPVLGGEQHAALPQIRERVREDASEEVTSSGRDEKLCKSSGAVHSRRRDGHLKKPGCRTEPSKFKGLREGQHVLSPEEGAA